uniref:Uncharacterized protein n=1 Tax=Rhizophora mucronata TaxID=61149 RepID=A0A2P2N177_RHIMU
MVDSSVKVRTGQLAVHQTLLQTVIPLTSNN